MTLERSAIAELELYTVRRWAQNRVHIVLVLPSSVLPATSFGVPCEVIEGPVVSVCGKTLRGRMVVIPLEYLDGHRRAGRLCELCVVTARAGLKLSEERQERS